MPKTPSMTIKEIDKKITEILYKYDLAEEDWNLLNIDVRNALATKSATIKEVGEGIEKWAVGRLPAFVAKDKANIVNVRLFSAEDIKAKINNLKNQYDK